MSPFSLVLLPISPNRKTIFHFCSMQNLSLEYNIDSDRWLDIFVELIWMNTFFSFPIILSFIEMMLVENNNWEKKEHQQNDVTYTF